MTVREELERSLAGVLGVVRRPSRWGQYHAYYFGDREIAHFHGDGRMDVRLTKEYIKELKARGELDARVKTRGPAAEWAAVSISDPRDVPLALQLVEDAVRANA